jgi:hypothetical protein
MKLAERLLIPSDEEQSTSSSSRTPSPTRLYELDLASNLASNLASTATSRGSTGAMETEPDVYVVAENRTVLCLFLLVCCILLAIIALGLNFNINNL